MPTGVDEHQVGEVEPGAGVVDQAGGIRRAVALGAELHPLGPDGAEVQVDGGGAGPAVEGEGHGTVGVLRAIEDVGGEHHLGDLLALLVAHRQRADRSGVVERLAGDVRGPASPWRRPGRPAGRSCPCPCRRRPSAGSSAAEAAGAAAPSIRTAASIAALLNIRMKHFPRLDRGKLDDSSPPRQRRLGSVELCNVVRSARPWGCVRPNGWRYCAGVCVHAPAVASRHCLQPHRDPPCPT